MVLFFKLLVDKIYICVKQLFSYTWCDAYLCAVCSQVTFQWLSCCKLFSLRIISYILDCILNW